jgi:regulator of protease activity HflC (stomatin/prohibitin superfamily)
LKGLFMKKLLLTLCAASVAACSQVNSGFVGIKTNQGVAEPNVLQPGWHMYNPLWQSVYKMSTQVQTTSQTSEAATNDLQTVTTTLTVNYHLNPLADPVQHFSHYGADPVKTEQTVINPAISEVFKAVVAQFTAQELVSKRAQVSQLIEQNLNAKLKPADLTLDAVNVTDFKFSEEYAKAIEQKAVSSQHVEQESENLAQERIKAETLLVQAQANAEALKLQAQQISPLMIQYEMAKRWDGVYPSV